MCVFESIGLDMCDRLVEAWSWHDGLRSATFVGGLAPSHLYHGCTPRGTWPTEVAARVVSGFSL